MKLDRTKCVFTDDYDDLISRLSLSERFVVMFTQPLAVDEIKHQPRVYMDDLMTARAVLVNGSSIPFCFLMDLAGVDYPMTTNGADLVDFVGWATGAFVGQFAGIHETPYFMEPSQIQIAEVIESKDSPDLWLLNTDLYSSLLVIDPKEFAYRVVRTWIEGYDPFLPDSVDKAVGSLTDRSLQRLINEYRLGDRQLRKRLFGEIQKYI